MTTTFHYGNILSKEVISMARTFDLQEWTKNKYVRKVLMLDKVKDKDLLDDIAQSGLSPTEYLRKLARKK